MPRRWHQGCGLSANDGGKRARSPRRARRKPLKPLRAGMPGDAGVLVVTRVHFYQCKAHTRPRVQRAPGIPHALRLSRAKIRSNLGRIAARECGHVSIRASVRPAQSFVTPPMLRSPAGRSSAKPSAMYGALVPNGLKHLQLTQIHHRRKRAFAGHAASTR
jgi:hypothetical protein